MAIAHTAPSTISHQPLAISHDVSPGARRLQRILGAPGRVVIDMDDPAGTGVSGEFDARYLAFLETITTLRPSLHRYCSRMTGSVMDGEDVVQEALIEAYRKLDQFDESRPLKPWLFRIA